MEKIRKFGATGNCFGKVGQEIVLSQYLKNCGDAPGQVKVTAYFENPNGTELDANPEGYSATLKPDQIKIFPFSITPNAKGSWKCHVLVDGGFLVQDRDIVYRIPVS